MKVEFDGLVAFQGADNGISVYRGEHSVMHIRCCEPLTESGIISMVRRTWSMFGLPRSAA